MIRLIAALLAALLPLTAFASNSAHFSGPVSPSYVYSYVEPDGIANSSSYGTFHVRFKPEYYPPTNPNAAPHPDLFTNSERDVEIGIIVYTSVTDGVTPVWWPVIQFQNCGDACDAGFYYQSSVEYPIDGLWHDMIVTYNMNDYCCNLNRYVRVLLDGYIRDDYTASWVDEGDANGNPWQVSYNPYQLDGWDLDNPNLIHTVDWYVGTDDYGGWGIGDPYQGDMTDLYWEANYALDITDPAVVGTFITSDGWAVSLGFNCSLPSGEQPAVCMRGNSTTFFRNVGYGGDHWTPVNLSDAISDPP